MEDVLEVYARPIDPLRPLVCLDECTKQLVVETRTPEPAKPGQAARFDYEYERNGTAAIFCAVAPHLGWRHIEERARKTRIDYAEVVGADDLRGRLTIEPRSLLAVAVFFGKTRLIDNILLG